MTIKGRARCLIQAGRGGLLERNRSIFTPASGLTMARTITIAASVILFDSTDCSECRLDIHHDLAAFLRVLTVAFAVGLDVFAVSVGVVQLALNSSLRVGFTFAGCGIAVICDWLLARCRSATCPAKWRLTPASSCPH